MKKSFILLFFLFSIFTTNAQLFDRTKEGPGIRSYVLNLGPMQNRPLSDIIDSFRAKKYDEIKLTYAIYTWIAENIAFDPKGFKKDDATTTTATLKNRNTTSKGYAQLFQTMCDVAGIKCYTIKGITKTHPIQLVNSEDMPEHFWNMVLIKDLLLFIDVTRGAGLTDYKGKNFQKEFADGWFLTNKDLFFLSHYTKDKNNPVPPERMPPKPDFIRAPIIYNGAVALNIYPSPTSKAKIRARKHGTKTLELELRSPDVVIKTVSVLTKYDEIIIPVKRYENILQVEIPFQEEGEYGLTLKINGVNCFGFMAVVTGNKQ